MGFGQKRFSKKKKVNLSESEEREIKLTISSLETYIKGCLERSEVVQQRIYDKLSEYKAKLNGHGKTNAQKVFCDNIEFDSGLEKNFYLALKTAGYKKDEDFNLDTEFVLQQSFKLHGKTIRDIRIYPDFLIRGTILVDTKGLATPDWKIKWKMLQYQNGESYHYFTPSNKEEIDEVITQIKFILSKG